MSCANPERINNGCMIYREDDKCKPSVKTLLGTLPSATLMQVALKVSGVLDPVANSEPEKRKLVVWRGARRGKR